jgi:hypothetical protein
MIEKICINAVYELLLKVCRKWYLRTVSMSWLIMNTMNSVIVDLTRLCVHLVMNFSSSL